MPRKVPQAWVSMWPSTCTCLIVREAGESITAIEAHRHRSDVLRMKKVKWSTVKKVLQVLVTIISTVIGTVAVQASVL